MSVGAAGFFMTFRSLPFLGTKLSFGFAHGEASTRGMFVSTWAESMVRTNLVLTAEAHGRTVAITEAVLANETLPAGCWFRTYLRF